MATLVSLNELLACAIAPFSEQSVLWAQFNIHLLPQPCTCSHGYAAPGKTPLKVLSAWNGEGQSPSSPSSGGSCDSCALQGPAVSSPAFCSQMACTCRTDPGGSGHAVHITCSLCCTCAWSVCAPEPSPSAPHPLCSKELGRSELCNSRAWRAPWHTQAASTSSCKTQLHKDWPELPSAPLLETLAWSKCLCFLFQGGVAPPQAGGCFLKSSVLPSMAAYHQ